MISRHCTVHSQGMNLEVPMTVTVDEIDTSTLLNWQTAALSMPGRVGRVGIKKLRSMVKLMSSRALQMLVKAGGRLAL